MCLFLKFDSLFLNTKTQFSKDHFKAVGGGSAEGLAGCERLRPMLRAAALPSLCTGGGKRPSVVGGILMCRDELLVLFRGHHTWVSGGRRDEIYTGMNVSQWFWPYVSLCIPHFLFCFFFETRFLRT